MPHTSDFVYEGLQSLGKAITHYYREDPTKPGVTVAWLDDKTVWYVSINRFKGAIATDKETVCSCAHVELHKALMRVVEYWLGIIAEPTLNPITRLRSYNEDCKRYFPSG